MKLERGSGILLHITSLWGKEFSGTMGQEAYDFADFLNKSGIMYWQILPLGPVSRGMSYSPYASPSTFAGNPLFISGDELSREKWFGKNIDFPPADDPGQVDFEQAASFKMNILKEACSAFFGAKNAEHAQYGSFCAANAFWLEDFALFAALSEKFGSDNWRSWPDPVRTRQTAVMHDLSKELEDNIRLHKFTQYIFFSQWTRLKLYCNSRNIKIIGDMPLYVSPDSADVWANTGIFQLNKDYSPALVAGVPPDYFSATGQRWGNPLYKWFKGRKKLYKPTFKWWTNRLRHLSSHLDIVRIDHFRGLESYWAIPSDEETAVNGKWLPGPGLPFFKKLEKELGDLPLIAEDLGIITPEVERLRDSLALPGMKILQFAFGGDNKNLYLPHNIENANCVVYTGTHDNNTINGWFYNENDKGRQEYIMRYLDTDKFSDMHKRLVRAVYASSARVAVTPMQDILGFGAEHRMNTPGTVDKNWRWRCPKEHFSEKLAQKLNFLGQLYNRNKND